MKRLRHSGPRPRIDELMSEMRYLVSIVDKYTKASVGSVFVCVCMRKGLQPLVIPMLRTQKFDYVF